MHADIPLHRPWLIIAILEACCGLTWFALPGQYIVPNDLMPASLGLLLVNITLVGWLLARWEMGTERQRRHLRRQVRKAPALLVEMRRLGRGHLPQSRTWVPALRRSLADLEAKRRELQPMRYVLPPAAPWYGFVLRQLRRFRLQRERPSLQVAAQRLDSLLATLEGPGYRPSRMTLMA